MRNEARAVMVCGTSSGAGKSFLTTALARWYARRGLKVAPFKAQNMSNNARVVDGGEIGSAQYFQALAARCVPHVRMNPVLLKPECDLRSQVVVLGRRQDALSRMEWRARAEHLWPTVQTCLAELLATHDVVVIEGAGSPAEINLQSTDIVNMRVAAAARAATLLICDIDRGGAFAHLFGTFELLPPEHRALIRGFVLNKFRGDAGLLAPAPQRLLELTGVPTVGVLPMWREHGLPEEDGIDAFGRARDAGVPRIVVAILAAPGISNLDEFAALERVPGLSLRWARDAGTIASADLLVLPGSKHTVSDLGWVRGRGLDAAIAAHLAADKPTLAICGGLQLLGGQLRDPHGVEADGQGLGLLPLATEFQPTKHCRHGRHTLGALGGYWTPLAGIDLCAYEIRHGTSLPCGDAAARAGLRAILPEGCGWQRGQTLAIYLHGLFENCAVMHALFGRATPTIDDTLDGLADFIDVHMDERMLLSLIG